MNGSRENESILRMENCKGEGLHVPSSSSSSSSFHYRDLKPMSSAQYIMAPPNRHGTFVQAKPELQIREKMDDAIWEVEAASPNLKRREQMRLAIDGPQTAQTTENVVDAMRDHVRYTHAHDSSNGASSNGRARGASHHHMDRLPTQIPLPGRRRSDTEPRHRSLDFDIHIDEPNIVALQDTSIKPLSDHLNEQNFSFRPKRAEGQIDRSPPSSNSQRIVRMVSASKMSSHLPPSHLQARESRFTPLEVTVDEEDEEDREERRVSNAASSRSRSESTRKLIDHGVDVQMLFADEQGSIDRKGNELSRASGASSIAGSARNIRSMPRTVILAKTRTKSRLVEPSVPCSASGVAGMAAASGRFEGAKKSVPQSPARPSVRKPETADAEEEDPLKDVDLQDNFRKGNLNAITIAQWVAFIVLMGGLACSLTVKEIKGHHIWGLELWKWFLLVLVVLCGRLVSGWLIRILVIIFEKNFLLRKKVLYFVYGLRKGVQNCLWLGLALLAWKLMFDPRVDRTTKNHKTLVLITKLLECFLIAAFIWLGKLLLVKSLASSFHVNTFFDRIQESLYHQHVLEALIGPPLLDISYHPLHKVVPARVSLARGVAGPGKKQVDTSDPIKIENVQKISAEHVSAGLMMQLMNLVKHPGISTLYTTFDEEAYANDAEDIAIQSELEAKAAAKMIFKNVAQEYAQSIEREDLLRFVTVGEVDDVLSLFEGAKDSGKITKKALKSWVVNVYQERKALAHSLNDTKTAVKELHRMANVGVIIIIIVVSLLVLGIATTHVLLFVSSQLLLLGFIFSNTLKQIFEAIIFLFVMHPFDVGDRCIIDGQQMVVEEMKILSTVFLKPDNEKVFYPNAVLATKPISNLYRSPNMGDVLSFSVHISTPSEKITMLKEKIATYVQRKTEHWQPKFSVLVRELEDMNRMRITVGMNHTINFQNALERLSRRSELLLELKRLFAELAIEYRLLTQEVQISYGQYQGAGLVAGGAIYPPPLVPYQGQVV